MLFIASAHYIFIRTERAEIMNRLNISEISSDIIENELRKVVEKQSGSTNNKLWIEHGSKKGDNYMGEIYRVLYSDEDNNNATKSLILKIAPRNPARREKFNARNMFLREITMYDEVISYFHDFQVSKGVNPSENGFNETPKCFHTVKDELSECLFLEDLNLRRFEMLPLRDEPLTFDHMSLCLKALGKFHAISFAIKDQQPEKFKDLTKSITERYWTNFSGGFRPLYTMMFEEFISILKDENRLDLYEKIKHAVGDDYIAKILELASKDAAEPYSILLHGDLTTNNAMFNKDEQGRPSEIQIFDWQFARHASPVTDLVLFLLCSSTKELRDQHYDEFLKIYHESLSDLLRRLGSDPDKLFSYDAFLSQLKKFAVYASFVGALLLPMLFADVDSMPDMDEMAEDENIMENAAKLIPRVSESNKKAYNKRIVELFDNMAKYGYI